MFNFRNKYDSKDIAQIIISFDILLTKLLQHDLHFLALYIYTEFILPVHQFRYEGTIRRNNSFYKFIVTLFMLYSREALLYLNHDELSWPFILASD